MAQDDEATAAIRGTTEKGECRSHACMTMSEPNSWDLNVVKVQPPPLLCNSGLDSSFRASHFTQNDVFEAIITMFLLFF